MAVYCPFLAILWYAHSDVSETVSIANSMQCVKCIVDLLIKCGRQAASWPATEPLVA